MAATHHNNQVQASQRTITRTPTQEFFYHFRKNRPAVIGSIIVLVLALVGISGWVFTNKAFGAFDPNKTELEIQLEAPSLSSVVKDVERVQPDGSVLTKKHDFGIHPLGTDELGRDVLLRLWSGSTVSLAVGFVAVGISILIGILVGGIAGYYGKGKARLPFLITILAFPLGTLCATFDFLGSFGMIFFQWGFYGLGIGAFALHIMGILHLKQWKILGLLGLFIALFAGMQVYKTITENNDPYGQKLHVYQDAQELQEELITIYGEAQEAAKSYAQLAKNETDQKQEKERALARFSAQQLELEKKNMELAFLEALGAKVSKQADIHRLNLSMQKSSAQDSEQEKAKQELEAKLLAEKKELEKGVTKAQKAWNESLEKKELKESDLLDLKTLQTQLSTLRSKGNMYKSAATTSSKELNESNGLYKFTNQIWILIIFWFCFLSILLMALKTGQDGALELPALRKFFIPIMTIDNFVMRVIEVLMTIPQLFLLLTILAAYDKDVWLVMFIIGITSWMGTARFVRAEILSLREQDFIQAARSLGVKDARIILKHLIPNSLSPVLVSATINVASAILLESTLSFLGIGAGPDQVTWGKMLSNGRQFITSAWWLAMIPGLAIFVVVLAFNLLGEGMREAMNPKLRRS